MTYVDEVMADNPFVYFSLEETGGTLTSEVGGYTATVNGALTNEVGPKGGKAAYFDGVNDSIDIPSLPSFTDTMWSFECWVKYGTQTMDYPTFMRRDGSGRTVLLRTRGPGAGTRIYGLEGYFNGQTVQHDPAMNDNLWHHLVYVNDSNVTRLYVDNSLAYNLRNGSISSTTAFTGTTFLGKGNGATEYFKGHIARPAFYNSTLSATRVAAHYNAASDTAEPPFRGWGVRLNPVTPNRKWL